MDYKFFKEGDWVILNEELPWVIDNINRDVIHYYLVPRQVKRSYFGHLRIYRNENNCLPAHDGYFKYYLNPHAIVYEDVV